MCNMSQWPAQSLCAALAVKAVARRSELGMQSTSGRKGRATAAARVTSLIYRMPRKSRARTDSTGFEASRRGAYRARRASLAVYSALRGLGTSHFYPHGPDCEVGGGGTRVESSGLVCPTRLSRSTSLFLQRAIGTRRASPSSPFLALILRPVPVNCAAWTLSPSCREETLKPSDFQYRVHVNFEAR